MTHYTYVDSPLGRILLTGDGSSLTGVYFLGQKYEAVPHDDWKEDRDSALFLKAGTQLSEYFAGERTTFELPLAPAGTPFQQDVWRELSRIACGTTVTYGSVAKAVGAVSSVRAVGAAVGRNPISIIIPCHRVLGSDGSLTGYAGGLERKRKLLALEAAAQPLLQAC